MFPLLRAEVRRITGRRGSFWGTIVFALVIMGITIAVDGGVLPNESFEHVSTAGRYAGLLGVVVMGALAGSYDTANGTMRYLVLTGVPRWKLALVRIVGIMVSVLPLAVLILVVSWVSASTRDGLGVRGETILEEGVWAVLITLWTWAIVSTAVGTLMRSNGPAIAVSIVLFFGGTLITGVVFAFVSETLANYLLPTVFEQVAALDTGGDYRIGLATAGAALLVWLLALMAAAVVRVQRDEY